MSEFVNTVKLLGDEAVTDSLIARTIEEYCADDIISAGAYALRGCTNLQKIDFPNLATAGEHAFSYCNLLSEVNMPAVTTLGKEAFCEDKALVSVDLPNLAEAGSSAFYNCQALTSVNLPKLVCTSVYNGQNMFQNCYALESLCLPCLSVVPNMFAYACKALSRVDLPMATTVGSATFYGAPLTAFILRNTAQVCTLANVSAFNNSGVAAGTGYIYVPRALVTSYQAATNWSTYAAQFRALEDYTVDGTTTGELDETKI